ncbi:MAG: site-specific integrase [Bacteroidia bacterium]|nr:site-specific integrase [Bacteroidia bacterium]
MSNRKNVLIRFIIKRTKLLKNGEAPIFARIRIGSQDAEFSIFKSIQPELWCPEKQAAIGNLKEAKEINRCIQRTQFDLNEHLNRLIDSRKEVTPSAIKESYLGKSHEKLIISLFHEHNNQVKLLVGKDFAPATLQRYETSLMHVQDYIKKKYRKEDIPVEDIDHEFLSGFELYLKTDRNCGHNTTMKYIKNFKKIIRLAQAKGWISKDPFAELKFKLRKVEKDFLTEDELNTIIKKDFQIERLENVKDTFLFGCFTGLAYSDLKKLTPDNLVQATDGNYWIHTKRTKTDNPSHIPLLPPAMEIVEKYKDNPHCVNHHVLLPVYSNQKLNAYLREIADMCGIRKKMTTHMARHTFATTVTLNNDIPIESVSKMLGHSSIKMTQVYARLLDKKVARDMSKLQQKFATSL